jgi:GT2 family glycosyltransferase
VIVAWNSGDDLVRAVAALGVDDADADLDVIVIDNASSDDAPQRVTQRFPHVRVHRFQENRGFAAACNAGARTLGDVEYLLFLNPDTEVSGQTVRQAADRLDLRRRDQTGICGIALRDDAGSVRDAVAREPTLGGYMSHLFGVDRLDWSLLPRGRYATAELREQRIVDQVCGAFFLMRADLFAQLGGFDERFFVYYEEADLSLRARQAGWHSWFAADLDGFHWGASPARSISAERLFYVTRSRVLFMEKHRGRGVRLIHLVFTTLAEPLARTLFCVGRHDVQGMRVVWHGFGRLYRWLLLRRREPARDHASSAGV